MSRGTRAGVVVFALAALVHLWRLDEPPGALRGPAGEPEYVYDECFQAFTAHRYSLGDPNAWNPLAGRSELLAFARDDVAPNVAYEWVHPPTAKLIMALGIRLFGFTPVSVRLGSAVAGLLVLVCVWRLGARLRGEDCGALAMLLAAGDGMLFVMSRLAMNDVYLTACVIGAAWALERCLNGRRRGSLALAGALLSFGLTMKWSAAPLLVGAAILSAVAMASWVPSGSVRRWVIEWVLGFVIAPPALYLASYLPYFAGGHGLGMFIDLQRQMIFYQTHLRAGHAYASPWWSWPLVVRPVWLYERALDGGRVVTLYAMGNPILWWAFAPAMVWAAIRWIRWRNAGDGLMLAGFLGAWLPWLVVSRVTFAQYFLPAVPFGALGVASALEELQTRFGRRGSWITSGYVALVVAAFVYFYPIWSGWPVTAGQLAGRHWFWFPSWR